MSLKEKLLKNSTIKYTKELGDSIIFEKKDLISTQVPLLNIAMTGAIDGGMPPGVLQIAGPPKHFKSLFALNIVREFLKKYSDGIVIFYDSEFGMPENYFEEDEKERIIHSPIKDIEELKHDLMTQLKEIDEKDHVLILIDSLGNAASRKEIEDAIKSDAPPTDMTRAKAVKSLFRMITPEINQKRIPCVVINHTYDTMEMYSKKVVSSGQGSIFNSNIIWVINSKAQNKDSDKELLGFDFTIFIEKSRYVREKSTFPITVSFEKGIDRWSGLLDLALESGYITKKNQQTYLFGDKEYKKSDFSGNDSFWEEFLKKSDFGSWVENNYKL